MNFDAENTKDDMVPPWAAPMYSSPANWESQVNPTDPMYIDPTSPGATGNYLLPPSMVREFGTAPGEARASEILNQLRQRAAPKTQDERIADAENAVATCVENVRRYEAMLDEAKKALKEAEGTLEFVSNPPTWRNVFDSSHRHWGHSGEACKAARAAGYPYFVWSGWILNSTTGVTTTVKETEIGG